MARSGTSPGLVVVHVEVRVGRVNGLREVSVVSGVFQLSVCIRGCMGWGFGGGRGGRYAIATSECSLQWGRFSRCTSYYQPGDPCRTLGIVMERERFQELTQQLETAHLICPGQKIRSHVFPTTSETRMLLQKLMTGPPARTPVHSTLLTLYTTHLQ